MLGKRKTALAAIIFTVMVLTAVNVGWWWYYRAINIYLEDQMSQQLTGTAAIASLAITPDVVEKLLIEDIDSYADISRYLDSLAQIESLSEAAILDLDFTCLVSTNMAVENESYLLSQLNYDWLSLAIEGQATSSRLYEIDGTFLKSAYAPLYDSSRQVSAILVAEAGASYFDILGQLQHNLYLLAGGSAGIIAILLIFYIIYNRRLAEAEASLFRAGSQAALGRMVAVVSHEVKNPLMILHAAGERLTNRYDDAEAKFIVEEVERLDQIVTGYLSFARGDSLESFSFAEVDLAQLARKIVIEFKPQFDKQNAKLVCDLETDQLPIKANRIGLRQVIINLLLNGLEATAENKGERVVRISVKKKDAIVCLTVSDNGPGIKESLHDKLFEPFYTTKTKGSGLGLYMCRKIITTHKGTIGITISDDNLTSFKICLPPGE